MAVQPEAINPSPYAGKWMASAYTTGGDRVDYSLHLDPDGTYQRHIFHEGRGERTDQGRWHHERWCQNGTSDETLTLKSDTPDEGDRMSSTWHLLSVTRCEDSNCLMVVRWAALASRNLPILFYRVHR
jgi:hypothetical protein